MNSIREDHNGTLWLGTFRDGLLKFDRRRNSFIRYSPDSDASYPDHVGALFEDSEGNIWVGGHAGVSHFQTAPLPFVNYQHILPVAADLLSARANPRIDELRLTQVWWFCQDLGEIWVQPWQLIPI